MSHWNKRCGITGIGGNGHESLEEFVNEVRAIVRVRSQFFKPPKPVHQPFSSGTLRDRKYKLKKRWREGEIPTDMYIDWLLSNRYPITTITREVGREDFTTFISNRQKALVEAAAEDLAIEKDTTDAETE